MGETAHHNHQHPPAHHNHQHPPNPMPPPPVVVPPLGAARGPVYPPTEQLIQMHYCIHSNPSWGQYFFISFLYLIMFWDIKYWWKRWGLKNNSYFVLKSEKVWSFSVISFSNLHVFLVCFGGDLITKIVTFVRIFQTGNFDPCTFHS